MEVGEIGKGMSFSVQISQELRVMEADMFGTSGRTTEYLINTVKVTGASRYRKTIETISAGISNQEINLSPLGSSNPGQSLLIVANQPVDIRLNASNNSMISQVRQLFIAVSNTISSIFLGVPGSADATVMLHLIGSGSVVASIPVP